MSEHRSFKVKPYGKKFFTIVRQDGFWTGVWFSKRRKTAMQKGQDYVSGRRKTRKLVWRDIDNYSGLAPCGRSWENIP